MRQEIKEMSMMLPSLSDINFDKFYIKVWILLLLSFFRYNTVHAQLDLVTNSTSDYRIVVAERATVTDEKAALVLQRYLKEISSVSIPVITDNKEAQPDEICIGKTNRTIVKEKFKADGFIIKSVDKRLFLIELSDENQTFVKGVTLTTAYPEENYTKETHRLTADLTENSKGRYIRIRAVNLKYLPEWRDFPNRKSWIFCDEIAVFEK